MVHVLRESLLSGPKGINSISNVCCLNRFVVFVALEMNLILAKKEKREENRSSNFKEIPGNLK